MSPLGRWCRMSRLRPTSAWRGRSRGSRCRVPAPVMGGPQWRSIRREACCVVCPQRIWRRTARWRTPTAPRHRRHRLWRRPGLAGKETGLVGRRLRVVVVAVTSRGGRQGRRGSPGPGPLGARGRGLKRRSLGRGVDRCQRRRRISRCWLLFLSPAPLSVRLRAGLVMSTMMGIPRWRRAARD